MRQAPDQGQQNRVHFYDQFISCYIPRDGAQQGQILSHRWFDTVPQTRASCPPLDSAINALSALVVGKANKDKGLITYALRLYVKALEELQSWHAKKTFQGKWHEAVSTSIALQLFEVCSALQD